MTVHSQSSEDLFELSAAADLVLFSHEFPVDDIQELFRALHRYKKGTRFPLLSLFLSRCDVVIQEVVDKLPSILREDVPPFKTITALAPHFDQLRIGPLGGSWEGVFLCIYQLAFFIGHYESNSLTYDLPNRSTTVAGMSVGLFAAAAVASSATLFDLAHHGAESVRATFAFCFHVGNISASLETRGLDEDPQNWAYVVTGLSKDSVQQQLDDYNRETIASRLNRVTISHADKVSIGVTGPPARLRDLFRHSEILRHSKHSPLQIHGGLCHVPNVYSDDDVDIIIKDADLDLSTDRPLRLQLLSPHTGSPFPAKNTADLIRLIVEEALTKPLHFDHLVDGIITTFSSPGLLALDVWHFRISIVSKNLLSSLNSRLSTAIRQHDLINWVQYEHTSPPQLLADSKLAIVGMACRMPGGANDTELFWDLLVNGRDVHTTVPPDRFNLEAHFDATGNLENSTDTPYGNFIDSPGQFDSGFFNMSPREAEQTDPMQRLALVTAYEALEMAGFVPDRTPLSSAKRVGTFFGQASDDYREVNANQNVGTYGIPGTERAFGNGRINYFFKFGGPSFNIDTACSSGLAAVHAACSSLWAGDSDVVIAGGLNVITNPDIYCMLTKGHFLSKTGQCKVWDENADGYCRADGIGSVVIKRLADAIADNDTILATVVAGATNHSCDAVSITHPHVENQKANYEEVLLQAGISPLQVNHVELHGTGTQAGDAVESQSVLETFAPISSRPLPQQRLTLGALKANIGHGEAAAGVASLIKVLLMYQKGKIPRHVGITTKINPVVEANLRDRNAGLVFDTTSWQRINGEKRRAVVNSFGAHGGNTTLLLEDAPEKVVRDGAAVPIPDSYIIALSAKSRVSLKGNIERLIQYVAEHESERNLLADLSYTLLARRAHYTRRIATSVSSLRDLQVFLADTITTSDEVRPVNLSTPRSLVFAFTGQGAFYHGAGSALYAKIPSFRRKVQSLDRVAQQLGFPSILSTIADEGTPTTARDLSPLSHQLSILILQMSLVHFWKTLGVKPDVVIGHSLGEYAALVSADVLSPADAIYLVGERAKLLELRTSSQSYRMLSVRASAVTIRSVLSSELSYEVSCYNTSNDTVISGPANMIDQIQSALTTLGIKNVVLDLPYAFHSAQLEPILDEFEKVAGHIPFKMPSVPVISPLLGRCIFDGKAVSANYLRRASREPVNFAAALDAAQSIGTLNDQSIWLEIGGHPVTSGFVRNHAAGITTLPSLRKKEDSLQTINHTLAALHLRAVAVNWQEYYRSWEAAVKVLHLKPYHWNNSDHFIPYTGTWTIQKAYHGKNSSQLHSILPVSSPLKTTSVQTVIEESIDESSGHIKAITNIQQSDFLDAVRGHTINGQGVVTGSIWADMALTVGEHLRDRFGELLGQCHLNVSGMEVFESQIPRGGKDAHLLPQLIQITASINVMTRSTNVQWHSFDDSGSANDHAFASAVVLYEESRKSSSQWRKAAHFVTDRIASLTELAERGAANRLSQNMTYQLFQNVVDYADRYRGMRSVVLSGLEAYSNIELVTDRHGTWHTPPHWIDSVFQVAGFVMNGSDETNTRDFFYITPGWDNLRMSKPLQPGIKYRNYVRMFPSDNEPNTFVGDIYLLEGDGIVGVCDGIKFRKIPRILMSQLFSAKRKPMHSNTLVKDVNLDGNTDHGQHIHRSTLNSQSVQDRGASSTKQVSSTSDHVLVASTSPFVSASTPQTQEPKPSGKGIQQPKIVIDCLNLIARETGLELSDFTDSACFNEMGIDSLMSLVLSEKLLRELGVEIRSSVFLEFPTVAEFISWLTQYY